MINAQQAPEPGEDIWFQHCAREFAEEIELTTAHSKSGGRLFHNKKKVSNVSIIFNGEENKFFLTQPIIPAVSKGGGKSG